MRVWSGVDVGSRRKTRGPCTASKQGKKQEKKSRCEGQSSFPNQDCMRVFFHYESNNASTGCSEREGEEKKILDGGGLPPHDYRPYFDWRLQSIAYPSHTHSQMACERARTCESTQPVRGADSRRYHSSAPSRFFGHLTVWNNRGRIVMRRPLRNRIVIRSLGLSGIP